MFDIGKGIEELGRGPAFPEREYVRGGVSFGRVYAMAAGLMADLAGTDPDTGGVCLATEDKGVLAAALLAALAGGPPFLLPYTLSDRAIEELRQVTGFTAVVSDGERRFSEDIAVIVPGEGDWVPPAPSRPAKEREILRIFTGGSTGAPRLWSKTGANMFGEALFLAHYFQVTEKDAIVATVPPYHIYGLLFAVLLPLVSGAAVLDRTPSFPAEIAAGLEKERPSLLVSIPVHYRALRDKRLDTPSLRLAFSSAGMLDRQDNEAFFRANGVGVVEVYGSTETGGIATRNLSRGEEDFTATPMVDWGISGERIRVRSPFLSPELPRDRDGFFVCGDRAEARGENTFALKGRADGVAKVGGKRVDLEEIRALIRKEKGVVDCVVMALPEAGGRGHRLAALIEGEGADMETIRKCLAASLETYALPRLLRRVQRIPVKENGKYDREAITALLTP